MFIVRNTGKKDKQTQGIERAGSGTGPMEFVPVSGKGPGK